MVLLLATVAAVTVLIIALVIQGKRLSIANNFCGSAQHNVAGGTGVARILC